MSSDLILRVLTETSMRTALVLALAVAAAWFTRRGSAELPARLLIGRVLRERGVALNHIRGDGTLQIEDELLRHIPSSAP